MKTAIIYFSRHHGNTKKLLDAIADFDQDVELIDVTAAAGKDLGQYDRVGLASGICYANFAKQLVKYASDNLPEQKPVFFIYTYGAPKGDFLKAIREITQGKKCPELGEYRCQGFDTFGPFKLVGGIAKGHPTQEEISSAVAFYQKL